MAVIEYEEFGPVRRWRVSRTLLGRPLFFVALFYVDGLLIDAGPTSAWDVIEPALAPLPVRQLVVTHHHEDHGGNAGRIAARPDCRVLAHPAAVPLLETGDFPLTWYRRVVWGPPAPAVPTRPLGVEVATEHHRFRVLHTPGHSADHVCLYEPDAGWLFTGDVFLHEHVKLMRSDEDLPQEIASMEQLVALPPARLFCGHHPRVWDDHREAIGAKLERFRDLRRAARELRAAGAGLGRIRRQLLGREDVLAWLSRGNLSKRNLIAKLLAWDGGEDGGSGAAAAGKDGAPSGGPGK